jgi:hypothetical protein
MLDDIPPSVRILPMDLKEEEFRGKSADQVQTDFFLRDLPSEPRRGRYAFKKAGLTARPGTVVLFQYDNRIIASAALERIERLKKPNGEYHGNLYFKVESIRIFEPVGADRVKEIWPVVKRFNRAKWHLDPSRYPEFERGLTGIEQPQVIATLVQDLNEIDRAREVDVTTKKALVDARLGQGTFRAKVLQRWDNCCSVTGSTIQAAIRASHIKAWRESSNAERLDPENGLPLIASLDALFDAGLISFDSFGKLVVCSKVNEREKRIFGIGETSLRKNPTAKMAEYLAHHRAKHNL